MNRILVTGGAGFIGSHLCERLLSLGYHVINIDNFNDFYDPSIKRKNIQKALADPSYTLVEGDIRDRAFLSDIFGCHNIDVVVHLAALAGVRSSIADPQEYIDVDIKGTVNILEACRKYKVKKLIFASSSSVYGNGSIPFTEDAEICSPLSPYAVSKLSGELFCSAYHKLYGFPIVCLRLFTVYGPRQRPEMAIHAFTRLITEGTEIQVFGNGKNARDYTYIDDIIDGIVSSISLKCGFETINLGNSKPIMLNRIISLIENETGRSAYKRYTSKQPGDAENTCASLNKASSLLGYKPGVSIEDGIRLFVEWYNSQKIQPVTCTLPLPEK